MSGDVAGAAMGQQSAAEQSPGQQASGQHSSGPQGAAGEDAAGSATQPGAEDLSRAGWELPWP